MRKGLANLLTEALEARRLMSAVTSFTLVDAATDRDIATLADGATLDLATLPPQQLNVRANISGRLRVRSVRFGLDGNPAYRTDNTYRYALAGNRRRDYFAWTPEVGTHTLDATPYPRLRARGRAGTPLAITFNVVNGPVPAPPSALAAWRVGSGAVARWTDNSGDEDGFIIERALNGGGFARVASLAPGATSYSDPVLAPGLYTYRVCAYNAAGHSPHSNTATVDVPGKPPEVPYSGPLVITRGGVYTGKWESLDPAVPAVTVRTAEPVVIENAVVRGRGVLIATGADHADVTVRNSSGYALNPNVSGLTPGRFFEAFRFDNVLLENNYLEGTGGIKLLEYGGDFTTANTVRVIGNSALNIDGRISDGNGGFLDFDERTRLSDGLTQQGYKIRQFVQLDKVAGVPGVEIAWNQVVNEPGRSRVEDNINIYKSAGTAASPIRIHDNYIQGAYTAKPWQASYSDGTWEYDWGYAGGGILLGDGETGVAYVEAYANQVVSTTNYGIAIAAGHDSVFHDNRVVSSGLLADGRPIAAQNVGLYIWDLYAAGRSGFYNNSGRNNLVGWVNPTLSGGRNDWWIPDATSFENNTHWPGDITREVEAAEFAHWQDKLAAAAVRVGPAA